MTHARQERIPPRYLIDVWQLAAAACFLSVAILAPDDQRTRWAIVLAILVPLSLQAALVVRLKQESWYQSLVELRLKRLEAGLMSLPDALGMAQSTEAELGRAWTSLAMSARDLDSWADLRAHGARLAFSPEGVATATWISTIATIVSLILAAAGLIFVAR